MKFKVFLSAILIVSLAFAFIAQSGKVSAQSVTPTTSPTTGPSTGPITFAGFKLEGTVTYRNLGRIWKSLGKVVPAVGVEVTAKNRETGTETQTTTDANGNYLFVLSEDKYKVTVDDGTNTMFVPPFRLVNLKKDKDGVNFQGLKFGGL
jgi:hypothetical protein